MATAESRPAVFAGHFFRTMDSDRFQRHCQTNKCTFAGKDNTDNNNNLLFLRYLLLMTNVSANGSNIKREQGQSLPPSPTSVVSFVLAQSKLAIQMKTHKQSVYNALSNQCISVT